MYAMKDMEKITKASLISLATAADNEKTKIRFDGLLKEQPPDIEILEKTSLFYELKTGATTPPGSHLLIIGPTGVGKSWIACALGHLEGADVYSEIAQHTYELIDLRTNCLS
jgi:ABC-type uncharacterized transport system fused permease/ATPase subunit